MTFETLDAIADAYIPLLLVIFLIGLVNKFYKSWQNYRVSATYLLFLFGLLSISYGLMLLDKALGLWPAIDLDYSTHTAVALSLVFAICASSPARWMWLAVSMLTYAVLMLYQGYHSLLDIISTTAVISLAAFFLHKLIFANKSV